jgi:Holliday junction DNA helicase RuvA
MIERLEGRLARKSGTTLQVVSGPLTLQVLVPLSTAETAPEEGEVVQLWTHLQWKEDGPSLFGFASLEERGLFRMLLQVQGVGPRIALSILSHLPPRELIQQIRRRSEDGLIRVPGVGKKTVGRILVELGPQADKLGAFPEEAAAGALPAGATVHEEAQQALAALGYPGRDAREALEAVDRESPGLAVEEQIRLALRRLSRGRPRSAR